MISFQLPKSTMRFPTLSIAALAQTAAVCGQLALAPGADGKYTISAPGIKAQFIDYGASLTNLYVKDTNGNDVDVVLGYDDINYYREIYPPSAQAAWFLTILQPRTRAIQSTTPFLAATSTGSAEELIPLTT